MRVTSNLMIKNMLGNLSKNYARLDKVSQQLSTGKRISKASDDPGDVVRALRIRTELREIEQYRRNVDTARSLMSYSDDMLGTIGDSVHRARELSVQARNDTYGPEQRDMMAMEIDGIINQMLISSNSTFANRFVFSGTSTNKPFEAQYDANGLITSVTFHANNDNRNFEIGPGQIMNGGLRGEEVFLGGNQNGDDGLFQALIVLRDGLLNDNRAEIVDGAAKLDWAFDRLLLHRAEVGARMNQLDLVEERMIAADVSLITLQTQVEDVDMFEAIMNLKNIEGLHHAALNVTGRIIQPTLLDFLR